MLSRHSLGVKPHYRSESVIECRKILTDRQLQRFFVSTYRVPSKGILRNLWLSFPGNATIAQTFCRSQKAQNLAYITYSVLGLILSCGFSGLLLICEYTIPTLVPWWHKRRAGKGERRSYATEQWNMDHAIELRRALRNSHGSFPQAFEIGRLAEVP